MASLNVGRPAAGAAAAAGAGGEGGSLSIQHVCCSTWTVVENAILSVALAFRKQSAVFVHLLAWACVLLEFDTFLLNEEGVVSLACLARLGSAEQIVRASEVQ